MGLGRPVLEPLLYLLLNEFQWVRCSDGWGPCCVLNPHLILSAPGLGPLQAGPPRRSVPPLLAAQPRLPPALLKCSLYLGRAHGPPACTVSAPPETMSPVLTARLRPAGPPGGQPRPLTAPCSLPPPACRRPAKQGPGRRGDSPGRQTAVLTYPWLPATAQLPQVPGEPLASSPCPPAATT